MGAKFFHVDRETYKHDEANSHFHNFANMPNNNPTVKLMMLLPSETSHGHFTQTGNTCVSKPTVSGHPRNDRMSHASFT
jgi:hypothetical protein